MHKSAHLNVRGALATPKARSVYQELAFAAREFAPHVAPENRKTAVFTSVFEAVNLPKLRRQLRRNLALPATIPTAAQQKA